MILLDDVVEVPALAQTDTARQRAFGFQPFHSGWKSRVPVHVDDPRYGVVRRAKSLTEKAFRSSCVAPGSEQKVDRLTGGIDSAVQVFVLALHLYIRLVGAPASIHRFQVRPAAPIQLGRIGLHPAPNAAGVHLNTAFGQKFGDVSVSQRIAQVPPYTKDDHLALQM